MQNKKYAIFIILTLKVPEKYIFLRFLERLKFQTAFFLLIPIMAEAALKALMYLWSF